MKKTNFLKGLAMAAIALVSVFTTSCSEEELSIKGTEVKIPELAAAKVQLAISVVDLENSKTLAQTIEDVTAKMGTTYSVACPNFAEKSQYTTTKNIEVQVPTIEKGQAVIIPVTFYVVSLNSALKDAMEDSEIVAAENVEVKEVEFEVEVEGADDLEADDETGTLTNTTGEDVTVEIAIPYYAGYAYRTEAKSIIADFANLKFTELTWRATITIPDGCLLKMDVEQELYPVVLPVIVDGEVVNVPLWEAGEFKCEYVIESIGHGHGHGHGHGDGNNTGGSEGEAE